MNKRLKRLIDEEERTMKRIEELQSHLKEIRTIRKQEEDQEIVRSIRTMKLEPKNLYGLLCGIQEGSITLPSMPADAEETEHPGQAEPKKKTEKTTGAETAPEREETDEK